MFENNNIKLFLFSIIPALIYSAFIYKSIGAGNIKRRAVLAYLIVGMLSPIFVYAMHFIFPYWSSPIEYNYNKYFVDFQNKTIIFYPTFFALIFNVFFQIAFLEEGCKWLSCQFTNIIRGSWVPRDNLTSTMFYYCIAASGFAIVENITYVTRMNSIIYDKTPEIMLLERSISSVLVHMVCGLFMGYFIALGRQYVYLKRTFYTLCGLVAAALLHGSYDFNLMVSSKQEFFSVGGKFDFHILNSQLIILSLLLAYFMKKHLKSIEEIILFNSNRSLISQ